MKGTQGPSRRAGLGDHPGPQADVLGKRQPPKDETRLPRSSTCMDSLPDRLPEATTVLWVEVGQMTSSRVADVFYLCPRGAYDTQIRLL